MTFGVLNYSIRKLRGVAITLPDIFSIRTALNVSDGMKVQFDNNFMIAIVLFIFSTLILWIFMRSKYGKNKK